MKRTVRERCANCGTIHTRREGDWIIEEPCPKPPPGPKCPPARWAAWEVVWVPDQQRMVLVHSNEPGNHGGADCWCKPQLKPLEEAGLNPIFAPTIAVSGIVGQRLPLDMSPLTPTGEALAALPWTEKERACIAELMALQDLSEFALIRQAVRTYQLVTLAWQREGLTMGFYDANGKRVEYPRMGSKLPPDGGN